MKNIFKYKLIIITLIACSQLFALTSKRPDGSLQMYVDTPLEGLVISINGYIGLGTLSPQSRLDVIGDIKASGKITAASLVGDGALLTNVFAATANKLASMAISQFTNDSGYLTTESDPSVQSYAKTKAENQLSVGTANVALTAQSSGISVLANSALTANYSANSALLGNKTEAALNVNSALTATTANKLASMAISQFTNDSSYLIAESDPSVQSYAKTKAENQLNVATALTAVTANYAGNTALLGGKTEAALNVATAVTATTANYAIAAGSAINAQNANNASLLGGKTETALNVNSALTSATANYASNSGLLSNKTESALNVNSSLTSTTANKALAMDSSGLTGAVNVSSTAPAGSLVLTSAGATGIKTANPNSTLDVNGSLSVALSIKTSSYTLTGSDSIVLANAGNGQITMTLPTAAGIDGRYYTIKKIDTGKNKVVIATSAGQLIDKDSTYVLTMQYEYVTLVSDGSNWVIIGNN
ncbi:MAG: hypothetical protein PHV30_05215 [Candidatus Margulisbacteria bacterium]|nr:hypothetical protein [Candidatus Margulisiibacteriota bacterium]